MAATMDTQTSLQDDLAHGTLMGLQELDSHLSMFDSNTVSTPGAASEPSLDGSIQLDDEVPSHTIVVDSSYNRYSSNHMDEAKPASVAGAKLLSDRNSQVDQPAKYTPVSHETVYLKPPSARDSLISSMISDLSDASSALSSLSSKATTPTGFDIRVAKKARKSPPQTGRPRQKYDIRPKVSIPTDIAPSEYARQCIAAAEASRLNPYSLHPEEYTMLRSHLTPQQVTTYLNIRNGILRLWTRNPLIGVMRDEAIGCAKDTRWFDVAVICHEWLVRRGYINYGCLEQTHSDQEVKKPRSGKRKSKTVVVIGAGISGLGCARQLEGLFSQFEDRFHDMGEEVPRVVVLEGRDRIGGRVYSRALKSKPKHSSILGPGSRHTAEMGGMIITGFDRGNPLNIILRGQLALPYHALRPDTTIYDATGRPVDLNRDQYAEQLFNYILDRVSEYKFKVEPPPMLDGDRDLLDVGRDPSVEGTASIREVEEGAPVKLQSNSSSQSPAAVGVQLVPVSSDRLTGRAHMEPGIPAVHTAAYKAREIGWLLRSGVGIEADLDLEPAVRSMEATLGSVFDEAIRQYTRIVDFTPLDLRLINWHVANLEYSNATTCNRLSLGGWDLDAGNEWEGKHTMVTGGYQQVPRGLLNCPKPLDVRKNNAVKKVIYGSENSTPSKVILNNGEVIEADYIVSSLPLGVLKRKHIEFEPPLPDWKLGAIQRIGFGTLNKVVLVYEEPFWDTKRDIFGTLRNPPDRFSLDQKEYFSKRGRFFQWFNCTNTTGLPTLVALMAGDAAFYTEKAQNGDLIEEATEVLRSVFGPTVPKPVEAVVTRWGRDKFAYGSYSYTGPLFRPDDYETMAKPVENLFFTGEHTCGTHPATVHGAYISGLRAASEVLDAIIGPIQIPEPLVPPKDSNNAKRKADVPLSQQDPKQAQLEAYELEIWNAIHSAIGDRPWRPANNYANPYRMYSKDKWEEAKAKCEEGRRPGKGKPIPNEVKKMVTKMWKEASESEKAPYNEKAAIQKQAYASALAEYNEKASKWDMEAIAIREKYVSAHPMPIIPEESLESPSKRDRKAKRVSGYAENSDSETEL